jgi:hypothetical protein
MGISMGIGNVGSLGTIIKRKFRFTMGITWGGPSGTNNVIPTSYIKTTSRPKLSIDSTEINFLNATTWLPGKAKWEPITVTYIDVTDPLMSPLLDWVATIYDFTNSVDLPMGEKSDWFGIATINMYDGCGNNLETWTLKSCYPESIDLGELAYSESEEMTIELQLRYSDVTQSGSCDNPTVTSQGCGGCNT